MALDRWLNPILDLARSIVGTDRPDEPRPRDSAPPRAMPIAAYPEPIEDARLVTASGDTAAVEADPDADVDSDSDAELGPIVSVGMARLLAKQGHGHRALAMFESLLARAPDDAALREEVAALRAALPADAPAAEGDDDDGLAGENQIVTVRANARDVLVSWQVDDARIARGRTLLPDADGMAVRLVVFHRGEGREVQRDERERAVERIGEWLVRDVPRDAWLTASIGLRRDDRFVSLTHSTAARVG